MPSKHFAVTFSLFAEKYGFRVLLVLSISWRAYTSVALIVDQALAALESQTTVFLFISSSSKYFNIVLPDRRVCHCQHLAQRIPGSEARYVLIVTKVQAISIT